MGGCFGGFGGAFGFAATAADGDVAEDAAFGPVAAAVFAEVTGLGEVVVVVVAELGVEGVAARALQGLLALMVGSEPPVAGEKPPSAHGVYFLHLVDENDEIAPETSVYVSECVVGVNMRAYGERER